MNPIIKNERPKLSVENEVSIETFVILVKSGIELWTRAGAILVALVEKNPNIYSEVIQKNPDITFEMLLVFEKIGRKQIYPALLMDNSPAAKRAMELPYEEQERLCKEQIEVLLPMRNGHDETTKKYLKELSIYESKMVIDRDGVRPIAKQKEFMATHGKQGRKKMENEPKFIGSYILKLSPGGALIAEKTSKRELATKIKFHEIDGTMQAAVNIYHP